MSAAGEPARANILGVGVSVVNMNQAVASINHWIAARAPHYVCITSVHGIIECQRDPELRRIFNRSGLTTPDGMPLVWLSRLAGFQNVERVYGPDLMLAFCEQSAKLGHRHFLYGGNVGVAEKLAVNFQSRFPDLQIAGVYSPPFAPPTREESARVIETINNTYPDVVWVGLSTPKQERWMALHLGLLSAPVLIGVGAAFDFHSGAKKQAPNWMRRSGLEWFFRLITEPRRLWRRYLVSVPLFSWLVFLQISGLKKFPDWQSFS